MAPKCKICYHPQRENIEEALLTGVPIRIISDQYGVSLGTINRHKKDHLPKKLVKAKEVREVASADNLLDTTRNLLEQAQKITSDAEKDKDLRTALLGIGKVKDILELLLKVTGELEDNKTEINIINNTNWIEIRTDVIKALKPYPEACEAVVKALEGR